MHHFKLIGHTTVFRETLQYLAEGSIPTIVGVSLCGRFRTCARIIDVDFVEV